MPHEAPNFFRKYKEAYDATAFEFSQNPGETSGYNPSGIVSSFSRLGISSKLYILLGVAVMLTYLIKRQRQNKS